jgi:hypothetical protein
MWARGGAWAISGGGHSNFFEKMDFCESLQEQYDPNENQIYEHKWDYFVCRIGECWYRVFLFFLYVNIQ